jgi:hypothetical protein
VYNNAGATDSGIGNPSCGVYNGGDVWFKAQVPASGAMLIETEELSLIYGSMAVYSGTCNGLTEIACDGYMPMLNLSGLTPGTTVFMRFFAWNNYGTGEFNLCVSDPCSAPLVNDLPCQAVELEMGETMQSSNNCATNMSEPGVPGCWVGGGSSSVWYKFSATSTGSTRVVIFPESIGSTQVALYSGSCSGLNLIGCSTSEEVECQNPSPMFSQLEASGLTPGQTYFLRVDGQNGDQGTFRVRVNSWLNANVINSQDCSGAIQLCGETARAADPGLQGIGAQCDFDGTNNCTGGEKNSIWYKVKISANGRFRMILTPNDGDANSCGGETDYDYLIWKTSGSGPTTDCDGITADPGQGLLACNYDFRGVCGLTDDGNAPAGYNNCYNNSFEVAPTLTAGDELLIVVQNFSTSTRGYIMDMSMSDPGMVGQTSPTTVYWDGSQSTAWTSSNNWGGCSVTPSCTINAVITPAASDFPVVTGSQRVNDLYIMPGASLTLGASSTLRICGDFENYGDLIVHPSSTVIFENPTGIQEINGVFSGVNALANLRVTKSSGKVLLNTELELTGDFYTTNVTSVFDANGNTLKLAGSFSNASGDNSFIGSGTTGVLEFVGSKNVRFHQGNTMLHLNKVLMNKDNSQFVQLYTNMTLTGAQGGLKLYRGVIRTGGLNQVIVENPFDGAVDIGNPKSYVEGNLVRHVNNTGVYQFPIGNAAKGYQRAEIDFVSNSVSSLTASFVSWTGAPLTLNQADCATNFDLPSLDNGVFNIVATSNSTTAVYDIKLFNNNHTNASGAGFTVIKDSGSGFELSGSCEPSTANEVHRTGLVGFSRFATAQASDPLPIELLSFDGEVSEEGNILEWVTASETNNEYFTIQRSQDGQVFGSVEDVPGAGFSSTQLAYTLLDKDPPAGASYYRLKQTDFDGAFTYSDVILLNRAEEMGVDHIEVYPIPTQNDLTLRFVHLYDKEKMSMSIYDMTGRRVVQRSIVAQEGLNTKEINISKLELGSYTLVVKDKRGEVLNSTRFLKIE